MMDGRFEIKQFSVDSLEAACQRGLFLQEKPGRWLAHGKYIGIRTHILTSVCLG